jgi:hypothetical protein
VEVLPPYFDPPFDRTEWLGDGDSGGKRVALEEAARQCPELPKAVEIWQ